MRPFEKHDHVVRKSEPFGEIDFVQSVEMKEWLFEKAHEVIYGFLSEHCPTFELNTDSKGLKIFTETLEQASELRIIGAGGVPESNFLSLFLINQILQPELYMESGYYKGSSLLAHLRACQSSKIIALDPNDKNLMLSKEMLGERCTFSKCDFRDYDFARIDMTKSVCFFDDHISTADRIIESYYKGFKTLIFDDSCGLMGTSERLWPSLPSLFFIENVDHIGVGQTINWVKRNFSKRSLGKWELTHELQSEYCSFTFDQSIIDKCKKASSLIKSSGCVPNMNDYIVTPRPLRANDITLHIVTLVD